MVGGYVHFYPAPDPLFCTCGNVKSPPCGCFLLNLKKWTKTLSGSVNELKKEIFFFHSFIPIFKKMLLYRGIWRLKLHQKHAQKGVKKQWKNTFWVCICFEIGTIFASKITIFQLLLRIASCWWSKPFRSWKSLFFSNCLVLIVFSLYFCDFCRIPIEDFPNDDRRLNSPCTGDE